MQIICHGLKEEDFQVEFTDHKIFLGRDESNSIVISAEGISRFHAILMEEGDDLFIQDNDSLNGVFLNFKRIQDRQKLAKGDIIQIGYRLIKIDFYPEKAVLDFVPPEQTEIVPLDAADILPVSPGQTLPDADEIEHTLVMSETQNERMSSEKAPFSGGSEIGKYIILKRIGKGGMGEVYLAKHKTLEIFRALKVLSKSPENDDTKFLDRFLREAKLASEIRHPNVVGVMDVETDPDCGIPYIVMEYVDGGSLRNSLAASKRLSEEQAVVIVEAIASALQAAEEHNIVHRDIKPDNIMFTKRGEVKLADLGIAKISGKDTDLTKTNMMIGTPAYLPPEQAQNAKGVDGRADIYSLGATFYEMLTGEQPYPGENTIEVLHKLFLSPVPNPKKINPEVSTASAAIVMKMLAKNPKDRFQNADELLEVMERTYPPHTAYESAELVKKVIAGECDSNTSFSSGISSPRFSFSFNFTNKLVFLICGLLIACCFLVFGLLYLNSRFAPPSTQKTQADSPPVGTDAGKPAPAVKNNVDDDPHVIITDSGAGNPPAGRETAGSNPPGVRTNNGAPAGTETASVPKKTYELQIVTTPDSEIYLTAPDGRTEMKTSDREGRLKVPGLAAGKYKIRIIRDNYNPNASEFELKRNMTLDLPLKAVQSTDLLLVNTDADVVDPNDNRNSLREALTYAQKQGTNLTVSFANSYKIRLSSPLSISNSVTIDGGSNHITITGPEKAPLFRVPKSPPSLTLKNLTLVSDYSGTGAGILNAGSDVEIFSGMGSRLGWLWDGQGGIPPGLIELVSVKDGGKAKKLWNVSGLGMTIDGSSYLHRLSFSNGAVARIGAASILEDATLTGLSDSRTDGDFMVYGTLKNATVSHYGDVYVFRGGICDNLTAKNTCFVENRTGGTINGIRLEYGAVYGYDRNSILNGTACIGGVTKGRASRGPIVRAVSTRTDVVFDLTDRTENSGFAFYYDSFSIDNSAIPHALIDNMELFFGANRYTVQVRENQPPGTYVLAGNATGFHTPISLRIGNELHTNALTYGKRFSTKNMVYTLSMRNQGEVTTTGGDTIILTIDKR